MTSVIHDKSIKSTTRITFWPQDPIAQRTQDLECVICIGKQRGRKKVYHNLLSLCTHFRFNHKGDTLDEIEFSKYIMAKYNEMLRGAKL